MMLRLLINKNLFINLMDKTLWLYVLKLKDSKYFLYDTYCTNQFEVLVVAHMNYDFLKKYKPLDIEEIIILEDHVEISYYLKKYMAKYGINSVRGGPYTEENLSPDIYNIISRELENENKREKKEYQIKEILSIYGSEIWSKIEIEEEIKKLESTRILYRKDLENYDKLKWINESVLYDIGWVRKLCSLTTVHYSQIFKEFVFNKYNKIIKNLKNITRLYDFYNNHIENDHLVFLKNPEFLFDKHIFTKIRYENEENIIVKEDEKVDKLCDIFELMINTLINRKMEYKYHIESYGEDMEWKIERAIYFLTFYSGTIH